MTLSQGDTVIKVSMLKKLLKELRDDTASKEFTAANSTIVDCCTYLIENMEETSGDNKRRFAP